MPTILAERRRRMLNAAIEDTLRWCARPDATVIGNYPTDQHWVEAFAPGAPEVGSATARQFLGMLKLASADWDHAAVAQIINALRSARDFVPERDLPVLVSALSQADRRSSQCTGAASKLASLVFPAAEVYVCHELIWRSVNLAARQAASASSPSVVPTGCDQGEGYGYAAFHAACRQALARQMACKDFVEAASLVTGLLRAVPGPLASCSVPDAFFQRYLLAKLLFHQGWYLKYGQTADAVWSEASHAIPHAGATGPRLYERLKSSLRIRRADEATA